jgi:ribosomal protein S18 acetylase RimI-like enzyme
MKYKKASGKDATAISLLWAEEFDYHTSLEPLYKRNKNSEKNIADFLVKAVQNKDIFICVATHNNQVVGFVWCEIDKKPPCFTNRSYGIINDIAVTEEQRGKGIAKELLKQGLEWFKNKNISHIETRVLQSNPLATKFWQSSGFEPYLEILRYKFDN